MMDRSRIERVANEVFQVSENRATLCHRPCKMGYRNEYAIHETSQHFRVMVRSVFDVDSVSRGLELWPMQDYQKLKRNSAWKRKNN